MMSSRQSMVTFQRWSQILRPWAAAGRSTPILDKQRRLRHSRHRPSKLLGAAKGDDKTVTNLYGACRARTSRVTSRTCRSSPSIDVPVVPEPTGADHESLPDQNRLRSQLQLVCGLGERHDGSIDYPRRQVHV